MLISEQLTESDVLLNKACSDCLHATEEHEENGKCYALDFNGTVYEACKCKKLIFEFKIKLKVPDYGDKV